MRRTLPAPRRPRALARAALALGGLWALTGCRVDAAVKVTAERDGSGTIEVVATADAELVAAAPGLAEDLRTADLVAAGWVVVPPAPTADGGLTVSFTHEFATPEEATALLAQVGGPSGPFQELTLAQDRSSTRVETSFDGAIIVPGPEAFADADLIQRLSGAPLAALLAQRGQTLAEVVQLSLRLDGPGPLVEADGTAQPYDVAAERTVVEWTAELAGRAVAQPGQPVHARLALDDATARRAARVRDFALWAIPAWIVFFGLVVLPLRYLARRRAR